MTRTQATPSKTTPQADPPESPLAAMNRLMKTATETYQDYWTANANPSTPQVRLLVLERTMTHQTNDLIAHLEKHWSRWQRILSERGEK